MRIIPVKLPHRNASIKCLVDDEDFESLSLFKWSLSEGYARTGITNRDLSPGKRQVYVKMHRAILWCPKGMNIDHKNRNRLDNQKKNLRVATPTQNKANHKISRMNKSGYMGVSYEEDRKTWYACIGQNGKKLFIGRFKTKEEAALAYNKKAKEFHGDFSSLNIL